MSGLHGADGSLNVTVVDGNTRTGLYAADGSINVVDATDETSPVGLYHACGAWNVTVVTSGVVGYYAANGSMTVSESPYTATGATRVTAISGSFGGAAGTPMGLLLALTYA